MYVHVYNFFFLILDSISKLIGREWPVKVRREIERSAETRPASICNTVTITTMRIHHYHHSHVLSGDNFDVQLATLSTSLSEPHYKMDVEDGRLG